MIKLNNTYNLTLLWTMFTATGPFAFYLAIPNHPYKAIIAVGIALMTYGFLLRGKVTTGNPIIVTILMLQILYSFIAVLIHGLFSHRFETLYINMAIQYIAVMITYLYINSFYSILKVGKSTVYIMAIMGILGSLAFVLCATGLLRPLFDWVNPDGSTGYNFVITFSKSIYDLGNVVIMRVAGFFDEPGTFAFFITFALLTNRLYDYSKYLEIILVITGLFTLSLAFFITLVAYFILFYGRLRSFKIIILVTVVALIAVFKIDTSRHKSAINEVIYRTTIARFQFGTSSSDKIIEGDNRSGLFKVAWDAFRKSPIIGHGFAPTNPASEFYGVFLGANLFTPLAYHGLLGTMFFFMHYFYFSFLALIGQGRFDRESFAVWAILTMNLFQRPNVYGGLYTYIVMIILIESQLQKKIFKKSQHCPVRSLHGSLTQKIV